MQRFLSLILSLLVITNIYAQKNKIVGRPKLVIGIVVDQMRWDYLYRYYDEYGKDGFKKLLSEGYNCQQTFINYLPSFTAPGHTCIYTGSVPAIHGMAGNDWIENETGIAQYCTSDNNVTSVGGSSSAGKMSPKNLLVTTVTDELRLATNMRSRVFGIAIKDRGGILPAGHLGNGAFWYDDSTGNFISSSYYMPSLPQWVNNFNNRHLPDSFLSSPWNLMQPKNYYKQSINDENNFEGLMSGEKQPVFPHLINKANKINYSTLRKIPAGNTFTLAFSKACINSEQLGQKNATDFLCVSLSSTDYIGHQYAPNSLEIEDTYLRLDQDLSDFIRYLDKHVGDRNYLLFLTADHGAAHNTNYLNSLNIPAGNKPLMPSMKEINSLLKKQFNADSLVLLIENYQVYLNEKKIAKLKIKRADVKTQIIQWLQGLQGVADVADLENMNTLSEPEPLKTMLVNGYNNKRSGCIQIILNPAWYDGWLPTGTTHGTWNPYDTHIPLLWYGWGILPGETYRTTYMTDIAATIAAMLHIQMPNGCIGKPIEEIMK